jgi:hypothetical protein
MKDPKLPDPSQLELRRKELTGALEALSNDLMRYRRDLATAADAPELAASVRKTCAKLSEAANGWELMSETLREYWGV